MAAKMQRMRQDAKDAEDRLWEYRMDVQAQVDKKMDRAQECMRKRYNWVNEGDVKEKMAAAQAARDATMQSKKGMIISLLWIIFPAGGRENAKFW